jgi:hypothetical protein
MNGQYKFNSSMNKPEKKTGIQTKQTQTLQHTSTS